MTQKLRMKRVAGGSWSSCKVMYSSCRNYVFHAVGDKVSVRNAKIGEEVLQLSQHTANVTSMSEAPSNPLQILTASLDGTVCRWDYQDEVLLNTYNLNHPILWMASTHAEPNIAYIVLDWGSPSGTSSTKPISHWRLVKFDFNTNRIVRTLFKETSAVFVDAVARTIQVDLETKTMVAIACGTKLCIWHPDGGKKQGKGTIYKHNHVRALTCVDVHPTELQFATGDVKGQIILWHGLSKAKFTKLHWHPHAVGSVAYSTDGVFLTSGGLESVFVLWQLESGRRTYIPRLGSAIERITPSPTGCSYLLTQAENVISCINPLSLSINWSVRGLSLSGRDAKDTLIGGKLLLDPRNNAIVMNGASTTGSLQFYNIEKNRLITQVRMNSRNEITRTESNDDMPKTRVELAAFSSSGDTLVTVDHSSVIEHCNLKFWDLCTTTRSFTLNSRVNQPHDESRLTALLYHPRRSMVVTASQDGTFKLWIKTTRKANPSMKSTEGNQRSVWVCQSAITYAQDPITSMAFSADGSVLAVAYGTSITLWDPIKHTLLTVLSYPEPADDLTHLEFAGNTVYLVAASKSSVFVWNLANYSLWWSYKAAAVQCLALDHFTRPGDPVQLVLCVAANNKTKTSTLLLFDSIECPKPSQVIPLSSDSICSVTFRRKRNVEDGVNRLLLFDTASVLWQAIEVSGKQVVEQSETKDSRQVMVNANILESMYGQTPKKAKIHKRSSSSTNTKDTNALFDTPAHILPSLSSLYGAYMDILLKKKLDESKTEPSSSMTVTSESLKGVQETPNARKRKRGPVETCGSEFYADMTQHFSSLVPTLDN